MNEPPAPDQPGQPDSDPSGMTGSRPYQRSTPQPGPHRPGPTRSGAPQPGPYQYDAPQPGPYEPGAYQPGSPQPGGQPPWTPGSDTAPTTWSPQVQPQPGSATWPTHQQAYTPGAATPAYQPAQYPAEGRYAGYPYAGDGNTPQPPRRRGKVVMVVAIVAAVAVVGGLTGWLATRSSDESKNVSATGSSTTPASTAQASSAPSAEPSTPSTGGGSSTVFTLPQTAAGLTLQPDSGIGELFSQALPSNGLVGKSTAGLYRSPSDASKLLLLFGAETKIAASKAAVTSTFGGFSSSSGTKFHRPKTYPAGSMGGVMECADGTIAQLGSGAPASICVVGDAHGLIITLFTNKTVAAAASATRTIRPSFEHG